ncbi:hypothetical protein Tco_0368791 [Tanacetum coccineum]
MSPGKVARKEPIPELFRPLIRATCRPGKVIKHIIDDTDDATASAPTPPTKEWWKMDSIVKSRIFLTLSNPLQECLVVADPQT